MIDRARAIHQANEEALRWLLQEPREEGEARQ
jgi:hypothetical protein